MSFDHKIKLDINEKEGKIEDELLTSWILVLLVKLLFFSFCFRVCLLESSFYWSVVGKVRIYCSLAKTHSSFIFCHRLYSTLGKVSAP